MSKPRRRTAEKPAKEVLYREIPDVSLAEAVTGAGTVDEIDLSDVNNGGTPGDGTSALERWVYVQCDSAFYARRYGETAPLTAAMVTGILWAADTVHEFYVDGNISRGNLAVESVSAGTLKIEFGSGQ